MRLSRLAAASGIGLCVLLIAVFVSYHLSTWAPGIAIAPRFHVGLSDGSVWFYSHDHPYTNIYLLEDDRQRVSVFNFPGICYRYYGLPEQTAWTFGVSLWYPILVLSVSPVIWLVRNRRSLRMNRRLAVVWLVLTLAPIAYSILGLVLDLGPRPDSGNLIFGFLILAMYTGYLLLVASYVVYLFKTRHVPREKRAFWAIILILAAPVTSAVFWFLYVWRPLRSPEPDEGT